MKSESHSGEPIPPTPRSSSSSARGAGAASASKFAGATKPSLFLWKACTDVAELDRVDIKQQAVLDGLRLGGKVRNILRNWINDKNQDHGAENLEDWAKQFGRSSSVLLRLYREKRELLERMKKGPSDSEVEEIEDQLEDIEATTSGTLETILLLFDIKEEDLKIKSTEEFLVTYPLSFLGTTKEINETDRETFVNKVKPFMESTPYDLAGEMVMLWPLIEHVTIFMKSDMLKYGLELLDLPGLGDVVESRSRVAERFSQKLDITAVVASTHRATEEKAVTGFIKKRQEAEMKMNGKFDCNSLCVILSKGEDIDTNIYLRSKWIAKEYPFILGHVDRAKAVDKRVRTAESENDGSRPETQASDIMAPSTAREVEEARQELSQLGDSLKQAAVYLRNRFVVERVQKDFRGRQAATKSAEDQDGLLHTGTVEVFPTSARSFQSLQHPGAVKEAGFPTEVHTGIPRLKQWLFETTMKKRENHLDAILAQLSTMFSRIENWISMSEDPTALSAVAKQDFDAIHKRHCRSLSTLLRQTGEEIKQIKPLKAKAAAVSQCQREFPKLINRWRYTYPDRPNSALKLFANSQMCILRKHGDFHQSKGKYSNEYQWVDDLSGVFYEQILDDWTHTFSDVVPGFEVKIQELLEHEWQRYMTSLNNFCAENNASHLTAKVQQIIESAEEYLGIRAHKVLLDLRNGAQEIHPLFRQELQLLMVPTFESAYSIRGWGCVRKQDDVLKQFAANNSANLPIQASKEMEARLEYLIQEICSSLEGIARDVVLKVADGESSV
ncbi:hypothetical protein DHEL01_v210255 [Diaporthe helianthi]|uniref:Tat pathway signal sequence n=1 Tax=Diaporthe helianthi TaxID=158607 RepID=A0A2P5HM60_DIAHE|nr:hypothetical protein DHEL01_v210255 [Diaporthe helianthi]